MALEKRNAAVMIKDSNAKQELIDTVLDLIHHDEKLNELSENIKEMALRDSAKIIAGEVLKLVEK